MIKETVCQDARRVVRQLPSHPRANPIFSPKVDSKDVKNMLRGYERMHCIKVM